MDPQPKHKMMTHLSPKPHSKPLHNFSNTSTQSSIQKTLQKHLSSNICQSPILKYSSPYSLNSSKRLFPSSPSNQLHSSDESFFHSLKFPTSPSTIISGLPNLPDWVKQELSAYQVIHFMSRCQKPLLNPAEIEVEGEIKVTLGDDIEYRYEILGFLGKGSFGEVFRAFDHQEKNEVAVKVVRSKEKYLEQARSEIEILKFIKEKSECKTQIVNFLRSFLFRNHLVLVFELLCENLYEFLRKNSFRGLKIQQIKKIACQVLKVLSFLEGVNLIHCDIKPENILIQSSKSSSIKMIDFGSACFEERQVFTYIQSRFYRAPEIVFGMRYSSAIDIWSFGCLLVELYTGMPIFPAENEKELISCITEVLGEPSSSYLSKGTRSHIYFYADGHIKPFQNSRGRRRYPSYRSLKSILKSADEEFVSLVSSCLQWDPAHRISASSALKIPWLCDTFKSPKVYGRYCKLSMEDIIKHTPHLHKLMTHKFKPSAIN